MPDLRLEIQNYLWSKFFADLDSIDQGLDSFLNAEPVEDTIEVTVGEYYEQICVIVSEIELRATTFGSPQVDQEDLQRLCHAIANIHIELRLQRDAICQASFKNATQPKYYEIIVKKTGRMQKPDSCRSGTNDEHFGFPFRDR